MMVYASKGGRADDLDRLILRWALSNAPFGSERWGPLHPQKAFLSPAVHGGAIVTLNGIGCVWL